MDKNKFGHYTFTSDRDFGFKVWIINVQASVGRRPPRRPGYPNSMFPT